MKLFGSLLLVGLLGLSIAIEREGESGDVAAIEETTNQVPVTSLKSVEDEEESSKETTFSKTMCSGICRRSGCHDSFRLSDSRCGCLCSHAIIPRDFFRDIFGPILRPRVSVPFRSPRPYPSFPQITPFGFPRIESRISEIEKLLSELEKGSVNTKTLVTMQQLCDDAEECHGSCTNCTSVKCVDSLCQCTGCNRETELESRRRDVELTCRSATDCEDVCSGCEKVTCHHGSCGCGWCASPEVADKDSETTETPTTTTSPSTEATESSEITTETVAIDVLSIKPNETVAAPTVGECAPTRCNYDCWTHQCSKWKCKDNNCECEGCPEEMSIIVRNTNGTAKEAEDNNKYEIIF